MYIQLIDMSVEDVIDAAAASIGVNTLKREQREAIMQFSQGRDVFVALPTGYGKSICYYSLPIVFDRIRKVSNKSIVVVVSPLIALMEDQVKHCLLHGVSASYVSSDMVRSMRRQILEGQYQIVFISPEALFTGRNWREMLKEEPYLSNLVGFIVDEAHCVKKW